MMRRLARAPQMSAARPSSSPEQPCPVSHGPDSPIPDKPALTPAILGSLSAPERIIYRALVAAAEQGEACPVNIELEVLAGYNSCSMGPAVLKRLERRGLIAVRRFQRFREVQITATGQWTTRPANQRSLAPHVPKGMGASRTAPPSDRKPYRLESMR